MDVSEELEKAGAIFTHYHFVYKSGDHGDAYVNADPIFPHVDTLWEIGKRMLFPFTGQFDVVAAPATGGIALLYTVAFNARIQGSSVGAVWADKTDKDNFAFERAGFMAAVNEKQVLVVDDTMIHPDEKGSVFKVCRLVEAAGGTVIGVSLLCNRCQGTAEQLKVPRLEAQMEVDFVAHPASSCPLCRSGQPIVADIGHGEDFQTLNPDYPGGYTALLD